MNSDYPDLRAEHASALQERDEAREALAGNQTYTQNVMDNVGRLANENASLRHQVKALRDLIDGLANDRDELVQAEIEQRANRQAPG